MFERTYVVFRGDTLCKTVFPLVAANTSSRPKNPPTLFLSFSKNNKYKACIQHLCQEDEFVEVS